MLSTFPYVHPEKLNAYIAAAETPKAIANLKAHNARFKSLPDDHPFKFISAIRGNCPFSSAQVVVCEDTDHGDPVLKEKITGFVWITSNEGDVVALEGYQTMTSIKVNMVKNVTHLGWDNPKAGFEAGKCLEEIAILKAVIRQKMEGLDQSNPGTGVSELEIKTFQDVVTLEKEVEEKTKQFCTLCLERDETLVNTVKKCLEKIKVENSDDSKPMQQRKIIVVAGQLHAPYLMAALKELNVNYVSYTFQREQFPKL